MPGSHLIFDRAGLNSALAAFASDTAAAADRHARAHPSLPATAAGRDFEALAVRLQEQLSRVHQAGQRRIDALQAVARAGLSQVDSLAQADEDFSAQFRTEGL